MTRLPERPTQPLKADPGIVVRASDSLSFVKLLQPQKADVPIVVTELGNLKDPVNPVQPEKAFSPISVTELGMTRLPERPTQPLKA